MAKFMIVFVALVTSATALPRDLRINPNGSWRVVGGSAAPDGAYPHQISLRKPSSHSCGGSILNEEWVVTAAHCVEYGDPSGWKVVAGSNQLNSGGQGYSVERAVIHPDYNTFLIQNDVALLKIAGPIELSDKVQPIALETENLGGGEDCVLCGWGTTSYPGSVPNNLQHLNLTTTSVEDCRKAHSNPVIDKEICTLTKSGEGACHGDSGGSLSRVVNNQRRLIGIVSWGNPCARGYPDVYTRVSSYADWINENCGNCAQLGG